MGEPVVERQPHDLSLRLAEAGELVGENDAVGQRLIGP
jgi:hypothetical protein